MCDLDPKVKVIDKKAGICDGVPSTAALVLDFAHDLKLSRKCPTLFVIQSRDKILHDNSLVIPQK